MLDFCLCVGGARGGAFGFRYRTCQPSFPITTMRRTLPITFVILSVLLEPQAAHAYLDPGTGSMLLSVFVGLISGVYFVIRKLPSTLRSLFSDSPAKRMRSNTTH